MIKRKENAKLILTEIIHGFRAKYWAFGDGECFFDIDDGEVVSGGAPSLSQAKKIVREIITSVRKNDRRLRCRKV